LKRYSNTKFHENPPSGSQVIPCGRTDVRDETVAFRTFANAPTKWMKPGNLPKSNFLSETGEHWIEKYL